MIAHLLIIFNVIIIFCLQYNDKAFLFLSWNGEAEVSVSLDVLERETKVGNEREKGNKKGKGDKKGDKRGKQEGKGK